MTLDVDIALDGDGPLHQQIRRAIARPILAGAWPPGRRIPSEHELMARFKVSRMTVNRALASLAGEGLVERRRKSGTMVAAPSAERAVFEIWDISAEIARGGAVYAMTLLSREAGPATAEDAERLRVPVGAPVLHLALCHAADGVPVQLEERLVNLSAAPRILDQSFETVAPGRWLLDHVPWTEAEHAIRAAAASSEIARRLKIPRGAACLCVERRTWRGPEPITFARLTSPAGAQVLVGRFRPGS
ncbi:MAG TPA: histidine utilization repressor [Beijerinckiaceae bacterium]|jgi:GntR family histidine utilization transcriptional repressor